MASLAQPPGVMAVDKPDADPFAPAPSDASLRQRYAGFDADAFSLYSIGSPAQARRALEAHLVETERRLQEASQLGSRLVTQRSDLAAKLTEIQQQDDREELDPQLRQRLVELEREFNAVGKETARAFLPKSRVPSNESQKGTESVLETGVRDSPSKVQPPSLNSRKQRNQTPGRMNDIKLATDISSSLLNQVRELQAAYAEKDEALKNALVNKSSLETDVEGLMGRLRALDESEQRYKDENWNLETRLQELAATSKAAADREARLAQHVNAAKSEKSGIERELEELKQAHGKLNEDHKVSRKQYETEMSNLQRNASSVETERSVLQRKIEELTSQNQELAKAMAYKLRATDLAPTRELTPEEDDLNTENATPEHSPPPSPTKGTPRHGGLESETLKSSLHHAHRMIQNLKNNIHREKTEKLEIRRMLQDARNELEERRADGGSGAKKRKPRDEPKEFKKPARPDRLGGARGATTDVVVNDEEWEDHDGVESPSRAAAGRAVKKMPGGYAETTDAGETEHSDDFETATEHEAGDATETDAFHTGAESLDGNSSDDLTETETAAMEPRKKTHPTQEYEKGHSRVKSFQSTASTSGEEYDVVKTPVGQSMRSRYSRSIRGRGATRAGTAESHKDSPASMTSETSDGDSRQTTPAGPSLSAELADFDEDDEDSIVDDETPSRASVTPHSMSDIRAASPLQQPELLDHDKTFYEKSRAVVGAALAGSIGFGLGRASDAIEETNMDTDAQAAVPVVELPKLSMSEIVSQDIEPADSVIEPVATPSFTTSILSSQGTEPMTPAAPSPPTTSAILSQDTEPMSPVALPPPTTSTILSQDTAPMSPMAIAPSTVSGIVSQNTEPETPVAPAPSTVSRIVAQNTEPQTPVAPAPTREFAMVEPKTLKDQVPKATPPFSISEVNEQYVEEPVTPIQNVQEPLSSAALVQESAAASEVDETPKASLERSSLVQLETEPVETFAESEKPSAAEEKGINRKAAEEPRPGFLGLLGLGRPKAQPEPAIAEDETSTPAVAPISHDNYTPDEHAQSVDDMMRHVPSHQSLRVYSDDVDGGAGLPGLESTREPMREIQPNRQKERAAMLEGIELAKSLRVRDTTDEGTQTTFSSEDIDRLVKKKSEPLGTAIVSPPISSTTKLPATQGKGVYTSSSPRKSRESIIAADMQKVQRRPGSSGSMRSRPASPPPLPEGHRQAIAAAAQRGPGVPTSTVPFNASSTAGQMGPPTMPASAYRTSQQYRAPNTTGSRGYGGITATTRTSMRSVHSGVSSPVTRRSSVSSFASEIDQRFNITRSNLDGFENATDPRMIQAITQTMIGEYLWKYTRKPGREAQSSTRHRRFFWVHPYTRTLYWSDQDPATAGRSQLKAKSVRIQAVRVVSDENPMPPGLHRKSLVVVTPGREIMFTAQTGGRHETWFNALSYLLLRGNGPRADDDEEATVDGNDDITADDVNEFNPRSGPFGGATSRMSRNSKASLSSYNTRASVATREYPTLVPNDRSSRNSSTVRRSQSQAAPNNRGSISNRLSSIAGSMIGNSFGSRHSSNRTSQYAKSESGTTVTGTESIYDASVVRSSHDSAEDLRRVIEKQERDADRLENVRACCDGKHDVGSLSHRGRQASHRHSTPMGSKNNTVTNHTRSATQVRAEA